MLFPKFCRIVTKMSCHNHKRSRKKLKGKKTIFTIGYLCHQKALPAVCVKHRSPCTAATGRGKKLLSSSVNRVCSIIYLYICWFIYLFIYSLFYPCMYSCFKGGSPRHSPLFFSRFILYFTHSGFISTREKDSKKTVCCEKVKKKHCVHISK